MTKTKNYQICHLDKAFEARIVLNVESVELDPVGPSSRLRLKQVLDLVIINIERQNLVRCLEENLLAEVRADETSGTDHAYCHRLYRPPVQIQSHGCLRHFRLRRVNQRKTKLSVPCESVQALTCADSVE